MKSFFQALLVATPLAAIILFFSLQGKEEIKAEQHLQQAGQALQEEKFDADFDNFVAPPRPAQAVKRAEKVAGLEADVKKAKQKRDGLDAEFAELKGGMNEAIEEEGRRLGGEGMPASAVAAGRGFK